MNRFTEILIHSVRYIIHKYVFRYYRFGFKVAIDSGVKVSDPGEVSIGDFVHLQRNVWINILPKPNSVSPKVLIGDNSDIGQNCFISAAKNITIAKNVLLSPNVFISDHSHQYGKIEMPIIKQGITNPQPVRLEEGCWVGINCVILPGVTIGKNCIIGANSVVTTSIKDYSVAVGSPAKVIKRYNPKIKKWQQTR